MTHSMGASLADYVHADAYARQRTDLGRLETFVETVARSEEMHLARLPRALQHLSEEIRWAFDLVRDRRVLCAMRSMRYAGAAITQHNARLYNTWSSHCSYPRVFAEALYLSMCGGGLGFSVQTRHVDRLPTVAATTGARLDWTVVDSIEGWAEAVHLLVRSYFEGFEVALDTSRIRPRGSTLVTAGGRAPGPEPLLVLEARARRLFEAARGRRLRPIEVYDLMCHIADAAMDGGSTRSAMLCVFSPDDQEMMHAKTGRWYETAPWRRMSNNSVVFLRGASDRRAFASVFTHAKEWGDPGVFWVDDLDVCSNSCVEVGFFPRLDVDEAHVPRLRAGGSTAQVGDGLSGFQGATLTEINGACVQRESDLIEAARAAAIINTLQATYTRFPFLGPVAELLTERDAMLGVGITGMMASVGICLDPQVQRRAAQEVVHTNRRWARHLGIAAAARTTLIKPAGKTSLIFGGVCNGIHPYHAPRYVLRMRAHPDSTAFRRLESTNPQQCEYGERDQRFAVFPVVAPEGALTRLNVDAIQHLEWIRSTVENWVQPGDGGRNVARHNVSNTVTVRDGEWSTVEEYLWRHQRVLAGVALLSFRGDREHPQAPLRAVEDDEDRQFRALIERHRAVDYRAAT